MLYCQLLKKSEDIVRRKVRQFLSEVDRKKCITKINWKYYTKTEKYKYCNEKNISLRLIVHFWSTLYLFYRFLIFFFKLDKKSTFKNNINVD